MKEFKEDKQMEKYALFVDWKNQYCQNDYTTQSMVFFRELEQILSQFVWKYKKTLNSQSNLEKEEWNWRNQPA